MPFDRDMTGESNMKNKILFFARSFKIFKKENVEKSFD